MKMIKFPNVCLNPVEIVLLRIDGKACSVQGGSVPAAQVPYTLSLSVRVSSTHPVSKVESNCSLDPLEYLNAEKTQTAVGIPSTRLLRRGVLFTPHRPLMRTVHHRSSWQLDINLTEMWNF